jgi:hypothetical protein
MSAFPFFSPHIGKGLAVDNLDYFTEIEGADPFALVP